jgi:predicted MFS family arabinose efflux permease
MLGVIFSIFAMYSYPPAIPFVMGEFGLSYSLASLPMSVVGIMGVVFSLATWWFISKWGPGITGFISLALCTIGSLVVTLSSSFPMLILGRIITGIGAAMIIVVSFTMTANLFAEKERGKAMGIKGLEMPIANILTFNLLPIVTFIYGWRTNFLISTVLLFVSALCFFALIKEKTRGQTKTDLSLLKRNAQIWILGIVWSLTVMGITAYFTWAGTLFIDLWGMNTHVAFFSLSIVMIIAIPLWPAIGIISDRIGRKKILILISSGMMAISFVSIPLLPKTLVYIAIVLLSMSSFSIPMIFASPPGIVGAENAGIGYGVIFTCSNLGISLGASLTGVVEDILPGIGSSFFVMALFSFLALIFATFLKIK